MAGHQDSEGRNLLHDAAHAVLEGDTRFFMSLMRMEFPMYHEDASLNFAAFTLCNVKDDSTFINCMNALIRNGFDINKENDDNETFLQRLCLSPLASQNRIEALLENEPVITRDDLSSLIAKHAISKQRSNKSAKLAIQVIRTYVENRNPS